MRFRSEFIVIHEDVPLPDETEFCPSWWRVDDFDADGDYYYDGMNGRWTTLELETRPHIGDRSGLQVWSFRADRPYEPGRQEHADLARYLDYIQQGRYMHSPRVASLQSPAITSLTVETSDLAHYREFLETTVRFLRHTGGIIANVDELDADEFEARFLGSGQRP